jgi:hypothetical protein
VEGPADVRAMLKEREKFRKRADAIRPIRSIPRMILEKKEINDKAASFVRNVKA